MKNQITLSRTASVLLLLAGLWAIVFTLWILTTGAALASLIITGAVIAISGLIQLFTDTSIPSWKPELLQSGYSYLHFFIT